MYRDRVEAGRELAKELDKIKSDNLIVLALPRGGVVLGAEVAERLHVPLGLVLVRKIGHPSYPEFAIGAIAEDEEPIFNENESISSNESWIKSAEIMAREIIKKRRELYFNSDIKNIELSGKTVVIVDDGIATGLTMQAAVIAIKKKNPKKIIIAVPVAAKGSVDALKNIVDEVVVLEDTNKFLGAVGCHYERFDQINDEEVRSILSEFSARKNVCNNFICIKKEII